MGHRIVGIRGRLIINVLALVAISLWILGVLLLRQNAAFLAAERRERGRALATAVEKALGALLAGEAAPGAGGPRLAAVQELLASLAEDPSVAALSLRDASGRTIASAGGGAAAGEGAETGTYTLIPRGVAPASLTVTFSPGDAGRRAAYAHLQVLVQLGITALVLVLFLHLLVSVQVIGPLRRLAAAAGRIAGGDLDRPVEARRRDELGDLAAAFEAMRERLRDGRELDRARLEELRRAHAELVAKGEELVRAERLAAIGSVAASVAHEVGNPLGAVTGYLALARGEAPSEVAREHLGRAERELQRIDRIMRDLLEYARPPRMDWTDVDLNALLRDLAQHLGRQPDFVGVLLRLELAERLPAVRADYHHTRQMLLNLALNAAQALRGAGTVTLGSFAPAAAGRAAGVRVSDDGPGIAPEVLARLFEPFATAGKGARGTGLGLAICRRTAEAMGATLEVRTAPLGGTTFTVLFPAQAPRGTVPPAPGA
ncbi:MAG TPA: ATP-binding protein [Candidatus Methanoperedens sp.]|nr:ATP-binding protein [Candidatus Methanoperedens sp.]